MRAAVLRQIGDTTVDIVDTLETVETGPGQVKIKIEATGLCHSDLHGMDGTIPGLTPSVLGHEGAGIVAETGEGVTGVREGDHVIIAWSPPCGQCAYCTTRSQPHLCTNLLFQMGTSPGFLEGGSPVFGFAGTGTFAEYTVVPQEAAIKIDDDVPLDIASLIGCGVMTGVGAAINTTKVEPGSTVVVFGCGGVGMSVIQGAKIAGAAEIVAVDVRDDKLEQALALGATRATQPGGLDALKGEVTGGDGFDYAFEAIGRPDTMRAAFDITRRGGTTCVVGVGKSTDQVVFNGFELFFSEKHFTGSYYGSADVRTDFHKLLDYWKSGDLDLEHMISAHMKLDDINVAIGALSRGEALRQVIQF